MKKRYITSKFTIFGIILFFLLISTMQPITSIKLRQIGEINSVIDLNNQYYEESCDCEYEKISPFWSYPLLCSVLHIIYRSSLQWLEFAYKLGLGLVPFIICINIVTLAVELDCSWLDSQ